MRAVNRLGYTAMHVAASNGHLEIIEDLLGYVDITQQAIADKGTALDIAAEGGYTSIYRFKGAQYKALPGE